MRLVGLRNLKPVSVFALVVIALCIGIGMAFTGRALAQDLSQPVLVVATPEATGPYRGTVLVATPYGRSGAHIGLLLNKPTKLTMAEAFEEFEPAKAVKDPIFLGGPVRRDVMFALSRSPGARAPSSFPVMQGVWLDREAVIVDAIIEATPNEARYFVGFVAWQPGQLAEEVRKGVFVVRPADAERLFQPDTSTMHEELAPAPKSERRQGT